MTPEKFIQDFWASNQELQSLIPLDRVITGDHSRLGDLDSPCAFITGISDQPESHTSSNDKRRASVRVKVWGTMRDIVDVRGELLNGENKLHRASWSGTGYAVQIATVENQFHEQEQDGEWQGINDIELIYTLDRG